MFEPGDIIYEDNHILVVNKKGGDLVQSDQQGNPALEDEIKTFIKRRDRKPGAVFLGVVHRIDRPVSGAVVFAKTSKALSRLNQMMKERKVDKRYWAVVCEPPPDMEGSLRHFIVRDAKRNVSKAYVEEKKDSKEARLMYKAVSSSKNFHLLEIELLTGRHHQIRAQLSKIGCPIRGDLKYGAPRSNPGGGISLHSRSLEFVHPVTKKNMKFIAPTPKQDNLWDYFEQSLG